VYRFTTESDATRLQSRFSWTKRALRQPFLNTFGITVQSLNTSNMAVRRPFKKKITKMCIHLWTYLKYSGTPDEQPPSSAIIPLLRPWFTCNI
jgi:hypothetical protein